MYRRKFRKLEMAMEEMMTRMRQWKTLKVTEIRQNTTEGAVAVLDQMQRAGILERRDQELEKVELMADERRSTFIA
jgi:hypothetical protein